MNVLYATVFKKFFQGSPGNCLTLQNFDQLSQDSSRKFVCQPGDAFEVFLNSVGMQANLLTFVTKMPHAELKILT